MIETAYICASPNRFSNVSDTTSSLLAFGSSNLICLWDISPDCDSGVNKTLVGHEGRVTALRFASDNAFVSADDTGVLLYWRKTQREWSHSKPIKAHKAGVSVLVVKDGWVISGGSDSAVKVWSAPTTNQDHLHEIQNIFFQGKYPLALALTYLPQSKALLLAIGGTQSEVQLWLRSEEHFVKSASLAGHEDWIKGLDFLEPKTPEEPLILASGSQDSTIRLWNIEIWYKQDTSNNNSTQVDILTDDLLDAFEESLGDLGDEEGGKQISLKRHILTVKADYTRSQRYSVTFDALLIGHDAGVTSLQWRPHTTPATPYLASTSTDSSVIVWSSSSSTSQNSIWINRQRFGDVGGQRLGGFVGGIWGNYAMEILAWGWSGGWRRWRCRRDKSGIWDECPAITGHSGPVRGIDWSPSGDYLLSASLDQTSRIHAPVKQWNTINWHEIARPQVHGYDLISTGFLNPLKFVSIADEKVMRVFEAPRNFVDMLETLNIAKFSEAEHSRPMGANVPPLGLSNKAMDNVESFANPIESVVYTRRPYEGELASMTLWPEIDKVFGHGYESLTLAVSNAKDIVATACRATSPEHAVIRLYDTRNFHPIGEPLPGHTLTITKITFSPDDRFILSVSRDRSVRIFEKHVDGGYTPVFSGKSHARIIWDCAWTKEGDKFATASRDKLVKIWKRGEKKLWEIEIALKFETAVTAVDFSAYQGGYRSLAIGLETGEILIYKNLLVSQEWDLENTIPRGIAHVDHIHRLSWRPFQATKGDEVVPVPHAQELASCSEDGTLKILKIEAATNRT